MLLRQIFDPALAQYAYLIGCQKTGEALVIDPERDIDRYIEIAEENGLTISAVAETHIHADFVSGSREFVATLPDVTAYLSDMGDENWKYAWAEGNSNVRLVNDGDTFNIGKIQITVVHTPGHTPEHISFLIEDQGGGANEPMAIATGDFVFVGDVGRPDLLESAAGVAGAMEPSARTLYASLRKFGTLPDFVQILPAHGAGSACGKSLGAVPVSTVGYEKRFNAPLRMALKDSEDTFVGEILAGQPEPPLYFANMKKVNKVGPAVLNGLPQPRKLDPVEIVPLIGDDKAVILDTRQDREAFMDEHVKGSLFTPKGNMFSTVAGSFVESEVRIYLLVDDEAELDMLVRELIRIGLDRVEGFAIAAEVLASPDCRASLNQIDSVLTRDIQLLRIKYPDAVVVDVRRAVEHAGDSIPGAINLAFTRLAANVDQLPDAKLIVHCESGMRGAFASSYLERIGADVIYADGPFAEWKTNEAVA